MEGLSLHSAVGEVPATIDMLQIEEKIKASK
jgi:hypothetical protein